METEFLSEQLKPTVPSYHAVLSIEIYASLWDALKDRVPSRIKKLLRLKIKTKTVKQSQWIKAVVHAAYPEFNQSFPEAGPETIFFQLHQSSPRIWEQPQEPRVEFPEGKAEVEFKVEKPRIFFGEVQ